MKYLILCLLPVIYIVSCKKTETETVVVRQTDTVLLDTGKVSTSFYKGNMHIIPPKGNATDKAVTFSITTNRITNTLSFVSPIATRMAVGNYFNSFDSSYNYNFDSPAETYYIKGDSMSYTGVDANGRYAFTGKRQ